MPKKKRKRNKKVKRGKQANKIGKQRISYT